MFWFRLSLISRVQLTIFQAPSHYLNQWWLFYWRIYASLGLNEMKGGIEFAKTCSKCTLRPGWCGKHFVDGDKFMPFMKGNVLFWFQFQNLFQSLFLVVQFTITWHLFSFGLAPALCQVTTRNNVHRGHWHFIDAPGLNELMQQYCKKKICWWRQQICTVTKKTGKPKFGLNHFSLKGVMDDLETWDYCRTVPLQWRHNGRDGVSNPGLSFVCSAVFFQADQIYHQRSPKLRVSGLCEGNPPVIDGFSSQRDH